MIKQWKDPTCITVILHLKRIHTFSYYCTTHGFIYSTCDLFILKCRLNDVEIVNLVIYLKSWYLQVILQNCSFKRLQLSIKWCSIIGLMFVTVLGLTKGANRIKVGRFYIKPKTKRTSRYNSATRFAAIRPHNPFCSKHEDQMSIIQGDLPIWYSAFTATTKKGLKYLFFTRTVK